MLYYCTWVLLFEGWGTLNIYSVLGQIMKDGDTLVGEYLVGNLSLWSDYSFTITKE